MVKRSYCRHRFLLFIFFQFPETIRVWLKAFLSGKMAQRLNPIMYNHDLQILISGTHTKRLMGRCSGSVYKPSPSVPIARWEMETEELAGCTHMQCSGRNDNRLNLKDMVLSMNWLPSKLSFDFSMHAWHLTLISLCSLSTHLCFTDTCVQKW